MGKTKVPKNTGIYFELFNTEPRPFLLPDNSKVDFTLGMPYTALDIYKKGNFPYLGLKDGAEVLFKQEPVENLIGYVRKAHRKEDVLILDKASDSEKVKAAVADKLKLFQS